MSTNIAIEEPKMTLHNASILLVEDNPGDVILIKEALSVDRLLLDIHVLADGADAIDFLTKAGKHQNAPMVDIILLDLNLPKKNGFEVIKEVRENSAIAHIPIVVLTSSKAECDILKTYQLNANCFIPKPLKLEEFIKVVQACGNFWFTIVSIPKNQRRNNNERQ